MKPIPRLFVVLTIILMSGYVTHAGSSQDAGQFSLIRFCRYSNNQLLVPPHFRQTREGFPTPSGSRKERRKIFAEETENHDEKFSFLYKQFNFCNFSTTIYYKLISELSFCKPKQKLWPRIHFSRFSTDTYIVVSVLRI